MRARHAHRAAHSLASNSGSEASLAPARRALPRESPQLYRARVGRKCTFAVIKAQANSVIDRAAEASGTEASEAEASEAAGAVLAGVGAAAAAAAVVGGCLLDWFVGWLGKLASKCSFAAATAAAT